ncbi:hypothetical protein TNCV_2738801 [Trichonephila clavipes]|nr:hypothetical protein TNCV_2738801 [Trichonephila clavipes]
MVFLGIGDGPVFAVFLFAALTRKVSDKSATIGFILGTLFIGFIGFGIISGGYKYPSLPIETSGYSNRDVIPADSKCLSPVASYWIKNTLYEKNEQQNETNENYEENEL